ncbi:MAG TPA: oligogalacturonate lyase family protein [Sphaerochaeta sp.]|nr:oligogalacturonate lyase family protein [Sphaerochaeta sp.]
MKGKTFQMAMSRSVDPVTQLEVTRITDNKANYDRPYFTTPQFTSDGKYTLFASDVTKTSIVKNPDAPAIGKIGFGELFLLELESGKALQLTQGEAIKMGHGAHAMLSYDGKHAYYYSNEHLKVVSLSTLESTSLMEIPFSYNFHSLSMTKDCRYIAFTVVEEVPLLTARFANPLAEAAPGARERFYKEPSSLVIRYDTQLNTAEVIAGGHHRITHVSLKPDDGDSLLFCHDGPWHLVQRLWRANAASDVIEPLFVQQHNLEGVVHEFFTPSGRVGAQYSYRYKPEMDFFLFADVYMDYDGKNQERFYYRYQRPGHISVSTDELLAVGDTAMVAKDMEDWERYVSLVRYNREDHSAQAGILCTHDTSGKKSAHVHPVFTPDDQRIIYSSDAEGYLNIYSVAADESKAIWEL